jgi:hypothetical protein
MDDDTKATLAMVDLVVGLGMASDYQIFLWFLSMEKILNDNT